MAGEQHVQKSVGMEAEEAPGWIYGGTLWAAGGSLSVSVHILLESNTLFHIFFNEREETNSLLLVAVDNLPCG